MKLRTVCSAISYVVALTVALPGQAGTTPADVSGAEPLNVPTTVAAETLVAKVKRSSNRSDFQTKSPLLHIEELAANRLNDDTARSEGYDANYIANFQESLTRKLAHELELRINGAKW